jgi:hypothetical protein
MSAIRKIVTGTPDSSAGKAVATPKNTGKRNYEEEQWHVAGFKPFKPPKKARIAVPDQQNFTETDCKKSLLAQVGGLRAENAAFRAANLKLKEEMNWTNDDNDVLLRSAQDAHILRRAVRAHEESREQLKAEHAQRVQDMEQDRQRLVRVIDARDNNIAFLQRENADLKKQWAEKERQARAFQLEMNDKLNSFLAIEL